MVKVWINGTICNSEDSTLSVMDRGFTLGDGVFETLYCDNGKIENFEYHILRLRNTLSELAIGLHIDEKSLFDAILNVLSENSLKSGVVRISVSRGVGGRGLALPEIQSPNIIIVVSSAERLRAPARMGISEYTRNDTSPLCGLKTLSYTDNIMALEDVSQRGFNEALILNTKGRVCCASVGNVFFVLGDTLVTPDLSQGCMAGITRALTIQIARSMKLNIHERAVSLEDIKNADAVFITNSIMKIRLVATIEETHYDLDNVIVESIRKSL